MHVIPTSARRAGSVLPLLLSLVLGSGGRPAAAQGVTPAWRDNETLYANQDPDTETRRSARFRLCFGHYNTDTGVGGMSEAMAQGNLQMFEQMWQRWVTELGLHDINESATAPDGNKYRANFNFLMTWDDGGGGGAYSSMDGGGFFYAMANPGYCRWDPPSGATPHEFGHVWEGSCAGFNGTDSSGAWWECMANWMQLQFLNSYPQAGGYIANGMYYPCHGRDYYDSFMIWETALEDPRYGAAWVNSVWTNATADQQAHEYIIDRMIRVDASGSPDKAGALKDLWGDMARKMVTWDYARQPWLAQANSADDGTDWSFYQRCRTPLVKLPGADGWYRPSRDHLPMEFGFNIIPLAATAGTTVGCDFRPQGDPVRQSDWRACLVAVNSRGEANYSALWNVGTNAIALSADQGKLYLVVIATPKPMKIAEPVWAAYLSDAGLQFPYAVSFRNATPKHVFYPAQSRTGMTQHANGLGWKASTATVDATAYIGPNAQVLNTAQVRGQARIEDYAVVRDSAQVRDRAVVSGHALVEDNAKVYGDAKVRDWGHVFGYAEIYENARVIEHANCGDGSAATHTKVYGNAVVKGTTYVYDTSTLNGCLIMDGDSANGNGTTASSRGVHFGWGWGSDTARFAALADNAYLYAQHTFEKDNAVFAMDQYGINHGFLIGGCRVAKDTVAPTRGGRVLPLDGVSQYVELHNSVNDFKDTAVAVWAKWAGGAADQRLWSLGDGAGKAMYLTPRDATTGGLRFVITNGTKTESLAAAGPLPSNTWAHVAVVFAGSTNTLYVNGVAVAANPSATLFPENLNAPLMENANYLGRGNAGGYFRGLVDDFRVSMKALTPAEIAAIQAEAAPAPVTVVADTAAPTPDAATWLVAPTAVGDGAITMSATPGSDASGWVEYFFACAAGGGHDSGWVAFNKYTDLGLLPGAPCTYTVRMRDRAGNVTAAAAPASATTLTASAGAASFAYGPIGIANGQITMTAAAATNASGKTEYKFDRTSPSAASSGWQSSLTWTQTGLTTGAAYSYTVTVRDGRGHVSSASAPASATARDDAAPRLPIPVAHWAMLPYATIDNKVSMTATAATDPAGVQYYFHCVSGGGPDSAWQTSATFLTPALPDGAYVYQYKVRDASAQRNESPYSTVYAASITSTTGYHTYTLPQVVTNADDTLVSFVGTVLRVSTNRYAVKDLASGAAIDVKPSTYGEVTDPALALKNVTVKGHLYTLAGARVVTYATVTAAGSPATYAISGKVTGLDGTAIAGATVYLADVANPSVNPVTSATTDANGNYSKGVIPGAWYVAAGAGAYNTSADRVVTVTGANVPGIDFALVPNARITGRVTWQSDGSPVAGAAVSFSRVPGAAATPVFTATTDAAGAYAQAVQDGLWYAAAGGAGFYTSADKAVTVKGREVTGIDFALKSSARSVPRPAELLFSVVTDTFPATGETGPWATYQPAGLTLATKGSPSVELLDGVKWERNVYGDGDGYQQARYAAPLACKGVTIVAAVKPTYATAGGEARGEIVDIFYDRLALAVSHTDGRVMVARNRWNDWGPALPNGQKTILSLVLQTNGAYKVYANGTQIMSAAASGSWTSINPDHSATWGSDPDYTHYVNVGRNEPDGWSTFSGYIGDVFVYTNALADVERQQLEADLTAKFLSPGYTITASAGAGGYINPGGVVSVNPGGNQAFTITPLPDYAIASVIVDGVARGAIGSYTFTNVTASHTIAASFDPSACRVALAAPQEGASFTAPATVDLAASVTVAAGHAVDRVQFLQGGALLGEATAAPYAWSWTAVAAGRYTLTARAVYDGTNSAASGAVAITVSDPPPPVVAIVTPTAAVVAIPAGVGLVLEATASTVRDPAGMTVAWTQTGGPGAVTFGTPDSTNTTARFPANGTYGLRFSATDGPLQASTNLTVAVGAAPAPWEGALVGSAAAGVGYTQAGGVFTVTAGGRGIPSSSVPDGFYFIHRAAAGDVELTARIVSVQNVNGTSSRGAVMIRETTNSGSRHACMAVSSTSGGRFVYRATTDGNNDNATSTLALPYWVRVRRVGNVFTAFTAPNGANNTPGAWTQRGTAQTIAMAASARVGLAATSGSATLNGAVVIDNVTVTPAQGNVGPLVDAGADRSTTAGCSIALGGAVADDGLPNPPGALVTQWSRAGGPGVVNLVNAGATNATATFPAVGRYVLRLTAADGQVRTFDDLDVAVEGLRISALTILPGGRITLRFNGAGDTGYSVYGATNLRVNEWAFLGIATQAPPGSGVCPFTDPDAGRWRSRFYRLQAPER